MNQQSLQPKAKRRTLEQLQKVFYDTYEPAMLPKRLFQCVHAETNELTDFKFGDYALFLDNVASLEDLIEGLVGLSPFADDALDVAESMTATDFATFKLALIHERRIAAYMKDWEPTNQLTLIEVEGEEAPMSRMPKRFEPILLPSQFIAGQLIAEQFQTSLSVAMIRNLEDGR